MSNRDCAQVVVRFAGAICDLLKPFYAAPMKRYEVSSRMNLVKNHGAACAEPMKKAGAAGAS